MNVCVVGRIIGHFYFHCSENKNTLQYILNFTVMRPKIFSEGKASFVRGGLEFSSERIGVLSEAD